LVDLQRRLPAILPRPLLTGALLALAAGSAFAADRSEAAPSAGKAKFYPDDPVAAAPKPRDTTLVKPRKTDALYDFMYNSFEPKPKTIPPAQNVTTLGEVPDSAWYANRHYARRMSIDELRRGPGNETPPQPPYSIVGAKLDGISPGFRMKDKLGNLYFIKPDPYTAPEIATSADVVGARFFHALGYHTPENYIVAIDRKDVTVAKEGTTVGANGKDRPMTIKDVEKVLWKIPRTPDGKYRFVASRAVSGSPVGPFRYEGTRPDDPNDVVPHEHRRELRGLHVFCAWLNHTDAKSGNSLDALVEENGVKFVRHYLIDFGAIFGSDSDMVKNARFGNAYIFPTGKEAAKGIASLGFAPKAWETAKSPKIRGVGRFEATAFEPDTWTSNFPNRAFVHRLPDDEFWAAKQVMNFTDAEIRAIVESGQYSDPRAVDYIVKTLIERRNRIGRTFFAKLLPLDRFEVRDDRLTFRDLSADAGFVPPRSFEIAWSRYDNAANAHTPLSATGAALPSELLSSAPGQYFAARIADPTAPRKTVTVYLRSAGAAPQIAGIDRIW
jgi:hypothetical protein